MTFREMWAESSAEYEALYGPAPPLLAPWLGSIVVGVVVTLAVSWGIGCAAWMFCEFLRSLFQPKH